MFTDEYFMEMALQLAEDAGQAGEIPVGAVVVCRNRPIAKASNAVERLNDVTAHAELMAVTAAANALGGKYLNDCVLYVTLEPCVMCAGALYWAQLSRLVFGAADAKRGFSRVQPALLHPKTRVTPGILADECETLLVNFFGRLRT